MEDWALTHLCRKFGENDCEYFLQTDNKGTVDRKSTRLNSSH